MGAIFTGKMTEDKIGKLLPNYLKLAQKWGKDVEVTLHPGYVEPNKKLIDVY